MAGPAELPARELFNRWLRTLTVLTVPGDRQLPERVALIAEANRDHAAGPAVTHPLSIEDADRVAEALHLADRLRSKDTGTRAVVTSLLLRWLSDAAGQPPSHIITRLGVATDTAAPPEDPAPSGFNFEQR